MSAGNGFWCIFTIYETYGYYCPVHKERKGSDLSPANSLKVIRAVASGGGGPTGQLHPPKNSLGTVIGD